MNKSEFAKVILDKNLEAFDMYISALKANERSIYNFYTA